MIRTIRAALEPILEVLAALANCPASFAPPESPVPKILSEIQPISKISVSVDKRSSQKKKDHKYSGSPYTVKRISNVKKPKAIVVI